MDYFFLLQRKQDSGIYLSYNNIMSGSSSYNHINISMTYFGFVGKTNNYEIIDKCSYVLCHPKISQFHTAIGVNQYVCSFDVSEKFACYNK